MRAAVASRYGPPRVLRVRDIPAPVPGEREVLLRVRAVALNPLDWKLLKGRPYLARLALGLPGPRNAIPGVDVAGVVEAVGPAVREFAPGDAVFGACRGALAEFLAEIVGMLEPANAETVFEKVRIGVRESPPLTVAYGLRYDSEEKFGGFGELDFRSLFGEGRTGLFAFR